MQAIGEPLVFVAVNIDLYKPKICSVCSHFTRWAMDIHLTDEEYEAVREFEWTLGGVLALTNDYFSWNKEKLQSTDRVRNAVPLLMRQYSLPQDRKSVV